MDHRRKFLKVIGASMSALGTATGITVGESQREMQTTSEAEKRRSAVEAGINSDLKQLFNERKFNQAHELLEESDVYHSSDRRIFRKSYTPDNGSGDVSTDAVYNKNDSDVYLNGWHKDGQVYRVRLDASLDGTNASPFDNPGPPDGFAFSFADSRWEADGNYSGDDIKNAWSNPEGIIAKVDPTINSDHPFKYYGDFAADVEKRGQQKHNIFGHYGHTWSLDFVPANVSFGIALGALSVSTTAGGGSWTIRPPKIEI